jgi:hypothetical protein
MKKTKRISVNYRVDPDTIAKIKAIAAYYGVTQTAAVKISITDELKRIDALQAGQISLQKKCSN